MTGKNKIVITYLLFFLISFVESKAQEVSIASKDVEIKNATVALKSEKSLASLYRYLAEKDLLSSRAVPLKDSHGTISHLLIDEGVIEDSYTEDMDRTICLLNSELNICEKGRIVPSRIRSDKIYSIPNLNKAQFIFRDLVNVRPEENLPEDLEKVLKRENVINNKTSKQTLEKLVDVTRRLNGEFETTTLINIPKSGYFTKAITIPRKGYLIDLEIPKDDELLSEITKFLASGEYLLIPEKPAAISSQSISTFDEVNEVNHMWKSIVGFDYLDLNTVSSAKPNVLIVDQGFNPTHPLLSSLDDTKAIPNISILQNKCDESSHGTHLWGILSSKSPGPGISKNSKIEILDITDDERKLLKRLMDAYKPLDIVNISQHFGIKGEQLRCTMNLAHEALFVVAAGNERKTFSSAQNLPVPVNAYDLPNVIVVGGVNSLGNDIYVESNRNTGRVGRGDIPIVHIAAPAENLYSTCNESSVGPMSGTSQATALVSGAAARLRQVGIRSPNLIKSRLMYTADFIPSFRWQSAYGRLNVRRALRNINSDSICLKQHHDPENLSCSKWSNNALKFGAMLPSGFKEASSLKIELNSGDVVTVAPDNFLRWVATRGKGSYGDIAIITKPATNRDNATLSRLLNVYKITDVNGKLIHVKLSDGRIMRLSRFGDIVRNIDYAKTRRQTIYCPS